MKSPGICFRSFCTCRSSSELPDMANASLLPVTMTKRCSSSNPEEYKYRDWWRMGPTAMGPPSGPGPTGPKGICGATGPRGLGPEFDTPCAGAGGNAGLAGACEEGGGGSRWDPAGAGETWFDALSGFGKLCSWRTGRAEAARNATGIANAMMRIAVYLFVPT